MRHWIFVAVLGIVLTVLMRHSLPATAAELIMMEQRGCSWCIRWHREIGVAYPKTEAAKIAPLRRVDIHAPWPYDLRKIKRDYLTPTFVLVEDGKELARLRGYPGDEFFWSLLDGMLAHTAQLSH